MDSSREAAKFSESEVPPLSPRRFKMIGQSLTMTRSPNRSAREMKRQMVSGSESAAEVLHMQELRSEVNSYVARPEDVEHFEMSKRRINEKEKKTMEGNVDLYVERMHLMGGAGSGFSPRKAHEASVPDELYQNAVVCHSPRRIGRMFDDAGYYDSQQKPLTRIIQPGLHIVSSFKQFLADRNWTVPKMLEDL